MPVHWAHLHRAPAPRLGVQRHYGNDLVYRDTLFVYPVTIGKNDLNENSETFAVKPTPLRASWQEHALDSEHDEVEKYGSRFTNLFTRYKGFVKWHDRVVCRGVKMQIVRVIDHMDNTTGEYVHTELRGLYLDEDDSLNKVNDPNK